jgi:hypothetical protein
MHRSFFPFIFVAIGATLVFACGVGESQGGNHDCPPGAYCPPTPQPGPDAGPDASTCDGIPEPQCPGCDGTTLAAECANGVWGCPSIGCPIQDAGCSGEPVPPCPAPTGPCGPYYEVECVANQWTCVDVGGVCIDDGGTDAPIIIDDAGTDAPIIIDDAGPPPAFACGNLGCEPSSSYCEVTTGGPVDAGSAFACPLLPTACNGGPATCACLGLIGQGCGCVEQHGDVTLTCELP